MTLIPVQTYTEDVADAVNILALVEANDYGGVDLTFDPYTMDAKTYTMGVDETWRVIRELAKAATKAQDD